MHSRAYMLLRRDLINLQRFPIEGAAALPTSDLNIFHWSATIQGLAGSLWEGGFFRVTLIFNEEFNTKPPKIYFMTIPFHPNIDPTSGTIACNALSSGWSESYTISSILLALQVLLDSPELEGGCTLNTEAARLLQDAPHSYRQMALDCITASLRIDAGLPPFEVKIDEGEGKHAAKIPPASARQRSSERKCRPVKPISFDDYYTLWKSIATSLPSEEKHHPLTKLCDRDLRLYGSQFRGRMEQQDLDSKLEQYALLKYGKPGTRPAPRPPMDLKARQQRIEDMKRMYREATVTKCEVPAPSTIQDVEDDRDGESGMKGEAESEVEELVQWTKELDTQDLNT